MRSMKLAFALALASFLLLQAGCSGARTDKPKADSDAAKAVTEGIPTGAAQQTQSPAGTPRAQPGATSP